MKDPKTSFQNAKNIEAIVPVMSDAWSCIVCDEADIVYSKRVGGVAALRTMV